MTNDMNDDTLSMLKRYEAPEPSPEAKKLALNAALVAFDEAQAAAPSRPEVKSGRLNRWKIGAGLGVPLGTAVAALVLLPLGTQLYTATSHRADGPPEVTVATNDAPVMKDKADASTSTALLQAEPARPVDDESARLGELAASGTVATEEAAPMQSREVMQKMAAPSAANAVQLRGIVAPSAIPLQPEGDSFQKFDENRLKVTRDEPVSTFSIDVDTASYAYVRSLLEDGYLPEPEAVRLEEMINYFPYDYAAPASLDTPFKASMTVLPTPWNPKTELLEIGIKGYVPPVSERQPQHLTFLIDTSGSMEDQNKLPLLKRSFGLLVDTLRPTDTVSIVVYAGSAGIVLEPTKADQKAKILSALDQLSAGGSTAGAEGIALAYKVAAEAKTPDSVNRVILATDGDFNVGIDTPDALKTYIKTQRDKGVFLSVLGFGRGNLDDALMQSLAQNGNGNASYIDGFREAQKVLVEEGGANLVTIAKDVKIQVEFNPAVVSEYRLIGYETRALNREDFNNDAVDAGEIGAGHTVTALYEITPVGSGAELNDPLRYSAPPAGEAAADDEVGFLKMRYKTPEGDTSKLIETPIGKDLVVGDIAEAGNDQRFAAAVAAFGQKLKGSNFGAAMSWQQIADLANGAKGADVNGYRAEFVQLVKLAAVLNPDGGTAPGSGDVPAYDTEPTTAE